MQEVRGSNPLSSTIYADQRHISILEMIFDFSQRNISLTSGSGIGILACQGALAVPDGSQSRRRAVFREPTWEPMVPACPAVST